MSLLQLQREFRRHILSGNGPLPRRVTDRAQRGLRVYAHAYRASLTDCLSDTYEKTAAWLGDDAFVAAASAYIESHPPISWTLADYGHDFADHLARAYPDDPEIAELAWLDRALRSAFAAIDTPSLETSALAQVDWEAATIRFATHVAARSTRTNVVAIWNALAAGDLPPSCLTDFAGGLLVWRDGLSPRFRSTEPIETAALNAILAGLSFAEMCAKVCTDLRVDAEEIGAILGMWLRDGLIVAID